MDIGPGGDNMGFQLDVSRSADMATKVLGQCEENARIRNEIEAEQQRSINETRQAAIETAENTAKMKMELEEIILNQNDYIRMLKRQNEIMKNIFSSGEDGVAVQKEIMQILQQQDGEDSMLKDKGLSWHCRFGLVQVELIFKVII
jgi:metal-dependent hydrolase (beta-lactamase superfamily II)